MSDESTVPFGSFDAAWPAVRRPELVAEPVSAALAAWAGSGPVESVLVVDTDPDKADTTVFCQTYDVPPEASANCVVVAAKRGQDTTLAACVVLATTRLDVNRTVRKHLGARKASFAPMDTAVVETGMEYGGITPLGLPKGWPLLVDEAVIATPHVLVGSGLRRGKLILPGAALAELPGAEVVPGLAG
ncbi:YbaK/EbsC family protein [Streptomyces sp. 549]|uniref:YbaK/EbsC family protein n=1 Tax=Streptomyces sp. 549 TaxID=3049076 RepID=UPI0024C36881|nr:YbaK/EbsC family protein [Streptomyces sp. 549]MDK1473078.1 YbaK/EbsC family protein [Streptomyces sp. 549]